MVKGISRKILFSSSKSNDFSYFCYEFHRCWVSGWGKNDFNGAYQKIQKEVDVPVLSPDRCQSSLTATRLGPAFIFDSISFICAGGESGKDACTVSGFH